MTELPYQRWFEADFANDTKTMSFADRCAYRAVLQVMWANHGWLPGNDATCARMLGCDTRTWRAILKRLRPRLQAELDPVCGMIWRQKRVVRDWSDALDRQEKRKAQTAPARAERSKKSAQRRSVTVPNGHDSNSDSNSASNKVERALARSPEPAEPSSIGDAGSGAPDVPGPASAPAAKSGALTGPFVPAAPRPPAPAGKSDFLKAYEAAGGDLSRLPKRPDIPNLQPHSAEPAQSVWDAVNQRFKSPKEQSDERKSGPDADDIDAFLRSKF